MGNLNDKRYKFFSGLNFLTYDDGTYDYYCFANPGTSNTDSFWKIMRVKQSDDSITWCDGNDKYDNVATDQGTVAGLSYS